MRAARLMNKDLLVLWKLSGSFCEISSAKEEHDISEPMRRVGEPMYLTLSVGTYLIEGCYDLIAVHWASKIKPSYVGGY